MFASSTLMRELAPQGLLPAEAGAQPLRERQALWGALTIWAVGLALSVSFGMRMAHDNEARARSQFEREALALERDVRARLDAILPTLKGLRSTLVTAPQAMHREGFRSWVQWRDFNLDVSGVRGLGLIERVERSQLDAFIAREQADAAPQFHVRTQGQAPDLLIIRFIEPIAQNGPAQGYDVGSEPIRRAAAELAIDSGQDSLTGRVTLVQDGQKRAGSLYFLPIYQPGRPLGSAAERRQAFIGLAYAPVVYDELLSPAVAPHKAQLRMTLVQADPHGTPTVLYGNAATEPTTAARYSKRVGITLGQQSLALNMDSTAEFEASQSSMAPVGFALVGAVLSTVISFTLWLLGVGRARAVRMVASRTRDLAEAKQLAEQALDERAELSERLALAIDGANDGLWDWVDVHRDHIWWSPQFFRLLGHEPGAMEVTPSSLMALLHPEDRGRTRAAMQATLRSEAPFDIEYRLRTASGDYRWFRARAKVYRDANGTVRRMAGTIQDVHERRLFKAALTDSLAQLEAIFALSSDAFVSLDEQGQVSYINPAFERLTGIPVALARDCNEAQLLTLLWQQVELPQEVRRLDELPTQFDRRPPVSMTLAIQWHHGQGKVATMLHLRDITREAELDRAKSTFISVAAHELRTPMASIFGFTELLLTREFPHAKQHDLLSRILRQSRNMIDIVNELLDLSRMEARQGQDLRPGPLELSGLIGRVLLDHNAPAGRAAPRLVVEGIPPDAWADEAATVQVLSNVLSNAYKYSPDGGDICITIRPHPQDEGQVTVSVRDHGIGMSPDQLARLGERFYRADSSGKIPGTGLGMAIVMGTMRLMGGSVHIDSALGQGTTVSLHLPTRPVTQEAPRALA